MIKWKPYLGTKAIRLSPKEIRRADPEVGITIVVRPQPDGTWMVTPVKIDNGMGEPWGFGNVAFVDDRSDIQTAVYMQLRMLDKMGGSGGGLADASRHRSGPKFEKLRAWKKTLENEDVPMDDMPKTGAAWLDPNAPTPPSPLKDMAEYVDALRASFMMPYPAIWNSLGAKRNNIKVYTSVQGGKGVLEFTTIGVEPRSHIVVVVRSNGAHEVGGYARGADLDKTFKFRPASPGIHRGTQGDISRYIEDVLPAKIVYKVYGDGPVQVFDSAEELTRVYKQEGVNRNMSNRKELQGQPTLVGMAGPSFDGRDGDVVSIRYETWELNDTLSRAASRVARRAILAASRVTTKKDIKVKNGDVIPRGTPGTLSFLGPRDPKGRTFCSVAFDWTGPSGRDYLREPFTTKIVFAHEIITGIGKPPGIRALERMEAQGICTTPTGKRVEPDGWGSDDSPAWLLVLGYI